MKRIAALLVICAFAISAGTVLAADRKSEDAKGPIDTFIFQPFHLIDKALTPPDDYEKRFHTTIEQEMEEEHLKAKAKAGR